ncbi:hypothetical protein FND50_32330 [Rhodococcus sp. WB9]|nr:hypothetical protein FND50_32330 [Rhodococcus sp. WB9]
MFLDADEDPNDPKYKEMAPWDLMFDRDHLFIGSPDTVLEKMTRMTRSHGIGNWLLQMGVPGIAHEDVDRSLKLFAAECMPALRSLDSTAVAAN